MAGYTNGIVRKLSDAIENLRDAAEVHVAAIAAEGEEDATAADLADAQEYVNDLLSRLDEMITYARDATSLDPSALR